MVRSTAQDIIDIKREVLRLTPPAHFSMKDIARSFFGALLLASTFIFSSQLITQAKLLTQTHIAAIILATILVLTVEIYFIGYERVQDKHSRKFIQFWAKRIVTFYIVALVVAVGLSYLYGFNLVLDTQAEVVNLTLMLSFPASVGAAIADLLRTY